MVDIVKEASEFNLPVARADRKLVATSNGGLKYPSVLVFHPDWGARQAEPGMKTFTYPLFPGIQRPANEEDIAFMSVRLCTSLYSASLVTLFDFCHQCILPVFFHVLIPSSSFCWCD